MNWLKVAGSKAGQKAFNPLKGSICARTDCDPALFNEYLKSAMVDWTSQPIVPSVVHGAAAVEKWATVYKDIMNTFATKGDVAATQKALQQACVDNGVCKNTLQTGKLGRLVGLIDGRFHQSTSLPIYQFPSFSVYCVPRSENRHAPHIAGSAPFDPHYLPVRGSHRDLCLWLYRLHRVFFPQQMGCADARFHFCRAAQLSEALHH